MGAFKKFTVLITVCAMFFGTAQRAEAVTYVTDAGGGGYDQAIAATNLAPAIALATVAIVAIVAIAVQNTHGHDHSSSHGHYDSNSSSSYSSCGSHCH